MNLGDAHYVRYDDKTKMPDTALRNICNSITMETNVAPKKGVTQKDVAKSANTHKDVVNHIINFGKYCRAFEMSCTRPTQLIAQKVVRHALNIGYDFTHLNQERLHEKFGIRVVYKCKGKGKNNSK
jgi:hypothetical protein